MSCHELIILNMERWAGRSSFHAYPFKYQYFSPTLDLSINIISNSFSFWFFQTGQTSLFFLQGTYAFWILKGVFLPVFQEEKFASAAIQ